MKILRLQTGNALVIKDGLQGPIDGWIEKLEEEAKDLPNFGILSALILRPDGKIFWHGGSVLPNNGVPFSYAAGEDHFGQYPGTRETNIVSFDCVLIAGEVFKKAGVPEGITDDIFEAANYCLTAVTKGFKIYATDKVIVRNAGNKYTQEGAEKFSSKFAESGAKFVKKWGQAIRERAKLPVCYHTGLSAHTGFANAAKGYVRGLHDIGVKVHYRFLHGDPMTEEMTEDEYVNDVMNDDVDMKMPQVIWAQAPYFFKNSGVYKIGHCEFEGDEWPETWIPQCNMMDEIWVPTKWDRNKAIKAGVNVPIHVIYQGIDPEYFHPEMAPMRVEAKQSFKFICNAAWLHRKNLDNLIRVFAREFNSNEDVCLIIKTMNVGLVKSIPEEVKKLNIGQNAGWVYIREDNLPMHQMPSFYRMGDCFVLPTHGEAWGLPIFEALACGIPTITTAFGAPNEVLRGEDKEPIPGLTFLDYKPGIAKDNYEYLSGKNWAEPNLIQLAREMRTAFENSKKQKAQALIGSKIVREKFSWQKVCEPIAERLQDIYKNKL